MNSHLFNVTMTDPASLDLLYMLTKAERNCGKKLLSLVTSIVNFLRKHLHMLVYLQLRFLKAPY